MVAWLGPASFAIASTVLFLLAVLTSEEVSEAVYVLLPVIIGLSTLAILLQIMLNRCIAEELHNDEESASTVKSAKLERLILIKRLVRPAPATIALIMAPAISLFWVLFLRLVVGEGHFDGIPSLIDFGPIHGIAGGARNVAFDFDNKAAVGTALQGFGAAICGFPALPIMTVECLFGHCKRIVHGITELGSAAFTFYPTFFMVKHLISKDDNFSTSTYVANATEWTMGYCTGMAAGFFMTSLVQRYVIVYGFYSNKQGEIPRIMCHWLLRLVHFVFGIAFIFTTFTSSILFGATWNTCVSGATDCVNFASNGAFQVVVAISFTAVPAIIILVTVLFERGVVSREQLRKLLPGTQRSGSFW